MGVPPDGQPLVAFAHRKNVTGLPFAAVPVGSGALVPPDTEIVAVSVTELPVPPGKTGPAVDACVVIPAWQFSNCPRTKSFSVALVDVDDRVSDATDEKHSSARPSADRFTPPS